MSASKKHQAVLVAETLNELAVQNGLWYIDATLGRGGHTREILNRGGKVIALDFDQEAIERAKTEFAKEIVEQKLILVRDNFKNIAQVFANLSKTADFTLGGILFDFGTSTDQLMSIERGFSFEAGKDAVLDMRMDQELGVKAADLLIILGEKQLAEVLFQYGGEQDSRRIARAIAQVRKTNPSSLNYVETLVKIVEKVKGAGHGHSKLHPATKTFQALRIAVNDELNNIAEALPASFELLNNSSASDKRLVCISFHEGEDRLVKTFFKEQANKNLAKLLYKKPITASEEELKNNPRSRSAKLRVLAI